MSILSKNKLSLPTAIGLGTTVLGAAGNILGQILGTGSNGSQTEQNKAVTAFRTKGVLRDNLFATSIGLPSFLGSSEANQDLKLYAESINLPGVNLVTGESRRYGYGPSIRYAKDVAFNDVTVSFIADAAGIVLDTFTRWMNGIVPFDKPVYASGGDPSPFFFRYKNEYVAPSFFITVFNESRDEVSIYYLEDAFPTTISDINLNWGSTNQLARFTVNFAYTRWTHTAATRQITQKLQKAPTGDSSLLSMLFQAGSAATLITSLGKPQSVGDVINVASNAAFILGRLGK